MPKPAYRSLAPKPAPEQRVELPHPVNPDETVVFRLRRMGPLETARMIEISDRLVKTFGQTWYPLPNGTAVPVNETIAMQVAMLEVMQVDPDPAEIATAEELLGMAQTCPDDYMRLLEAAVAIQSDDAGGLPGKGSREAGVT